MEDAPHGKNHETPPPLISFFASLEVQLAIIIIDYCAVICIIDPRQKVKRFISQIAYFEIVYYPRTCRRVRAAPACTQVQVCFKKSNLQSCGSA